ncbi:uncharacterized protein A4U43_C08F12510 [Asparagus officinalis]|nr:uncharacterized protein A4U43_C08F12510 [Asparagus officinalis]
MKQQNCCSSSSSPPLSFPSLSSLSAFLKSHIPSDSLSSGLTPGTKTLNNLYLEITNGKSSLLTRTVNVAILRIKNPRDSTLLETQHLLFDGTLRSMNRPLSEKMTSGKPVKDAAARTVREELRENVRVRVLMETYWVEVNKESHIASSCIHVGLLFPDDGEQKLATFWVYTNMFAE